MSLECKRVESEEISTIRNGTGKRGKPFMRRRETLLGVDPWNGAASNSTQEIKEGKSGTPSSQNAEVGRSR